MESPDTLRERFAVVSLDGEQCMAVYSPSQSSEAARLAVVIVVGGPQYRAGSHRQFTLLARELARAGIPSLRFDYRGMGDSDGEMRTFESIDADIGAAIDELQRNCGASRVVLWGLCDGATAALIYAPTDSRVVGVVAANPWARTPALEARTRLRHYYLQRIVSPAFWRKLLARRVALRQGAADIFNTLKLAPDASATTRVHYLDRMHEGWRAFGGRVLFLLSGEDLTAREFETWVAASAERRRMLEGPHAEVCRLPVADHTFSTRAWRDEAARATIDWTRTLMMRGPQ